MSGKGTRAHPYELDEPTRPNRTLELIAFGIPVAIFAFPYVSGLLVGIVAGKERGMDWIGTPPMVGLLGSGCLVSPVLFLWGAWLAVRVFYFGGRRVGG